MGTLVKKISIKTVLGNYKEVLPQLDGKKAKVMRVAGIARKMVPGSSDMGEWVRFEGNFKAINMLTGEEFMAAKCFLPDVAGDILESAFAPDEETGEVPSSVEFGFDIVMVPDDTMATGYFYEADPLKEPAEDDSITRLMSSMPKLPRSVPKPEPTDFE